VNTNTQVGEYWKLHVAGFGLSVVDINLL